MLKNLRKQPISHLISLCNKQCEFYGKFNKCKSNECETLNYIDGDTSYIRKYVITSTLSITVSVYCLINICINMLINRYIIYYCIKYYLCLQPRVLLYI